MYQLHYQLSTTAANELKTILQERIRDTFESGQPIDEVAKETMGLLNALYKGIENFSYSNGTFDLKNGSFTGGNGTMPVTNGASAGGNGTGAGTQGATSGGNGTVSDTSLQEDMSAVGDKVTEPVINIMPAINELKKKS